MPPPPPRLGSIYRTKKHKRMVTGEGCVAHGGQRAVAVAMREAEGAATVDRAIVVLANS